VQGQTSYSTFSPRAGNTRTSWLTGAAAWSYFSAAQYILGIRPEPDGLRIDPCVPNEWGDFSAVRKFRGASYRIHVHNPGHVCKGVMRMTMDGRELAGTLLPVLESGEHRVEVWLGH
jgi:cellobiose phosphorylase